MSFDLRRCFVSVLVAAGIVVALGADPVLAQSLPKDQHHELFDQALRFSRQGNPEQALVSWDRVLELAPDDAAAWSNRGNVRLVLGDTEGAIADQTRAIELAPTEADPHLNRGTAEEALQRWTEAEQDYNWILKRDPQDASALYNLGNVRGSEGDWESAEHLYRLASEARPGFAMARSSRALALYQLDAVVEAEREMRNLIRRYPMFADARAGLSALLWIRGSHGEAESNWAAAAGLDPSYRDADWLLQVRRWPPRPVSDLQHFLALERP